MKNVKEKYKAEFDSIKFIVEDNYAKVIGIRKKINGIKGIPANLKYYRCKLISKATVPRKTLKALNDFIDCFIMIKENVFEKKELNSYLKEYYSTKQHKQVFVYTKLYVDPNDLTILNRNIHMTEVLLYVNEAIAYDDYLSDLTDVQVKAIPQNIIKGDFYE